MTAGRLLLFTLGRQPEDILQDAHSRIFGLSAGVGYGGPRGRGVSAAGQPRVPETETVAVNDAIATVVAEELQSMREARKELGTAGSYLSTEEAVALGPLDISEETLIAYPEWVCPRLRKDPRRARSPYLWDPRDILALPIVLRQWMEARRRGDEADFRRRRERLLEKRDNEALTRASAGAA